MKKSFKIISALILSSTMTFGLGAAIVASNSTLKEVAQAYYTPSTTYEVSDTAAELTSYYSSISSSATGSTLLSALQSLNSTKRKKTVGYSAMGTSTSGAFIYTDYDLNKTATDSNGQTYGTAVASFYTKTSATSWNREHMWPNSHGGNVVEADIFMTRPTITSENSSRGNSFYVEGKNSSSAGWDPYTAGYEEWVRGECARVILYCVVASSQLSLTDAESHSTSNSNKDYMMGDMDTLIKWHYAYTPNVYEINRNNGGQYLQGNRNPFVDHPEYVSKIWGSGDTSVTGYTSAVNTACQNSASTYSSWVAGSASSYGTNDGATQTAPTALSISPSSSSVAVGSKVTLTVTATGGSNSVNWSSSNTNVATVSNGVVTGVAAGSATITATSTLDSSVKATATITVKALSTLTVTGTPTKTSYSAGERFNSAGLTVTATYSDNSTVNVTSDVVWTPNPLTQGTTSVTGTYGGKTVKVSGLTVTAAVATGNYKKVTSGSITDGQYLIVYETGNVAFNGALKSLDAASNTVGVTISSSTIQGSTSMDNASFTISASNGSIKSASGYYIGATNNANTLNSNTSTVYTNTITISDGNANIKSSGGAYLRYNNASDQARFRYYKSGSYTSQQAIQLYKKDGSSTSTATLSSIETAGQTTSYQVGDTFSYDGVCTATYSDSTTAAVTPTVDSSSVNMNTAGTYTVNLSYTEGSVTKTTSYTITVSASASTDSISLDKTTLSLISGNTATLVATATGNVTWSSNKTSVATVSSTSGANVTVTAVAAGTATITATCGTASATCTVTVTAASTIKTVSEARTLALNGDTSTYSVQGIVTEFDYAASGSKKGFYINDTNGTGIDVYTGTSTDLGVTTGQLVVISGSLKKFNSLPEITSPTLVSATHTQDTVTPITVTSVSDIANNVGNLISITAKYTSDGSSSTTINDTFTLNGSTFKLYSSYASSTAATNYIAAKASWTAGTTEVTLVGIGQTFTSSGTTVPEIILTDLTSNTILSGDFAQDFLDSITCNANGTSAPTFGSPYNSWSAIASAYSALTSAQQSVLTNATANESGTTTERAIARYDYIISKYGTNTYEDFMGRNTGTENGTASNTGLVNQILVNNNNTLVFVVITSITLVSLTACAMFLAKKRKED